MCSLSLMDPADLKAIGVFASLSDADHSWIAQRMAETRVPIGSQLVKSGDFAYRFFGILEGTAAVTRAGHHVAILGPGDVFGEIAVIDDSRRSADVVATTPMRLATMMSWDFREALARFPQLEAEVHRLTEERLAAE